MCDTQPNTPQPIPKQAQQREKMGGRAAKLPLASKRESQRISRGQQTLTLLAAGIPANSPAVWSNMHVSQRWLTQLATGVPASTPPIVEQQIKKKDMSQHWLTRANKYA